MADRNCTTIVQPTRLIGCLFLLGILALSLALTSTCGTAYAREPVERIQELSGYTEEDEGVFVVSALFVVYNVWLKRLDNQGKREQAERIDKVVIWVYPLLYLVGAIIAAWLFLL